jgi:hypothetical protein
MGYGARMAATKRRFLNGCAFVGLPPTIAVLRRRDCLVVIERRRVGGEV